VYISVSSPELLTFLWNSRWRPPPSWIFSFYEFGNSGVLIVWYLCSVSNLVQISVIVTEIDQICFRPSFDDVTRINFRFRLLIMWSSPKSLCESPHGRDASSHIIWCKSKVVDIFPKFKMAAAAILDFQLMWIWPFRRVGSVVFVFCTKFGSNICYSHWDRRTYASDLHLMTSRELTSGFNFWSRGHLCVALVRLPMKFGADIFIQSGVIDIFPKIKDGGRRHLGIAWVSHGTTHEASFIARTSCKNFVMIG